MEKEAIPTDLCELDVSKLQLLNKTPKAILKLEISQNAFAQIIDGEPTRRSYRENYASDWDSGISERDEPSEAAVRLYQEIVQKIDARQIMVDLNIIQAFQNAPHQTSAENLRLLEFVSTCLHSLAGMIYHSFHPETNIFPDRNTHPFYLTRHYWVDFFHVCFKRGWDYPYGLLNVIGYWIEAQIFGGVVLFERGTSGSDISSTC